MRFLKGAFTFAAFSALAASAPYETKSPTGLEKTKDLTRPAVDLGGLNEHIYHHPDTPPACAREAECAVEASASPPVEQDFRDYLTKMMKEPGYIDYNKHLLFWSGMTDVQALDFATKNKRFTVGELVQRRAEWTVYQKPKSQGGYWKDWAEVTEKFWDPVSKVAAEIARGDVYAYFSEERAEEQKNISRCLAVWCRIEKRPLVQALRCPAPPRVISIAKYIMYSNGTSMAAGFIDKLTD
ncbi:hypothetical protein NOR_05817 [Metarhizium rileyi]|uniref:Uncharacterized protein n=1 Tax=Metarhizium rileyi (strain RCEF 4871) TaxID=1649241 RepID=A0A167BP41_METRR|nr:hypothetical protein NOR_05817 [Metarhizium rileyi RCEF 4871]